MRKSNSKKDFFVIVAALLAAVGIMAAAGLLYGTDAREFYFRAESRNFERYSKYIDDRYTLFQKKQEPYMNSTYKRRMEITADLKADGKPFGLKDADSLFELIKKCKLVVDSRQQPVNGTTLSNVSLLVEKVPFLDAELFTKDRTLCFSVPVILPGKYFSIKLDQMDEVYDRFSIPVKPRKLITAADIAKTIRFDRTALDKSLKNLGSIFSARIGKNDVTYGEERELNLSGRMAKGREVSVSLDPQTATSLLRDLGGFISTDETLLEYTYGNFADLALMIDDAGIFRLLGYLDEAGTVWFNEYEKNLLNMINVKKDLNGIRKLLENGLNSYSIKDGLNMVMVIGNNGEILDRKLDFDLTDAKGIISFGIDIHSGSSSTEYEDCRNRFMKITVTRPDANSAAGTGNNGTASGSVKSVELQLTPVFSKAEGADIKGNVAINYAVTLQSGVKSGMDMKLDILSLMDNTSLKRNQVIKYKADIFGESSDGNVSGEINRVTWENKKLNTLSSTADISVKADLPGFGIKNLSAEIKLAGEDKFGIEPFNLPELRQSNVIDLNTADEKDLDKVRMQVLASFGTFYLENRQIIDVILGQ